MKNARNLIFWCFFASLLIFFLGLKILIPPPIQGKSIDFRMVDVSSNLVPDIRQSNTKDFIFITVSNISKNTIMYDRRHVSIAFLRNGIWETNNLGYFFLELVFLSPNYADQLENFTIVPTNTEAIKVGVPYTSLTWRGEYAFRHPPTSVWRPLKDLDEAYRSKTEWSESFALNSKRSATNGLTERQPPVSQSE
jgi:hypothetical protein